MLFLLILSARYTWAASSRARLVWVVRIINIATFALRGDCDCHRASSSHPHGVSSAAPCICEREYSHITASDARQTGK